ncbi:MAG: uracil-DNA glycosylase, partial [Candidatus Udaeobacter sp.]
MSHKQLDKFLRLLKASPSGPVFNPWWQIDSENDISSNCPAIRRKQLSAYFRERLGNARLAIVGEALGYRGGHFSGIPMTSERMLLGKKPEIIAALHQRRILDLPSHDGRRSRLQIIAGINPHRTSKPSVCQDGFSEPTATIVWGALLKIGVLPNEFVLWNAFPWHSFDPQRGRLSNRMPNKSEQLSGRPVLKAFLELFACEQIVALGKIAAAQLEQLGVHGHCVRHPASG